MIYDFMGKVKNVKNDKMLETETLTARIKEIGQKFKKPLELKVILSENESKRDLLVKSSVSVSSYPSAHTEDLAYAITTFKSYLEDIAVAVNGEVSRTEGFYNNNKTFNGLY